MGNYAKAWQCEACPQSNGEQGCPAWSEIIEAHVRTGEERITKDCLFRLLPKMMVEVVKASNRPAAELGEMRAELFKGFSAVGQILLKAPGG